MSEEPKVLYNGGCPVCNAGVEHYRRIGGSGDACSWVDVTAVPDALAAHGLTLRAVKYRLHYITAEGKILRGVHAFAAIWDEDPRFRRVARLVRLPVLNWIAACFYELIAGPLYLWNAWRGR